MFHPSSELIFGYEEHTASKTNTTTLISDTMSTLWYIQFLPLNDQPQNLTPATMPWFPNSLVDGVTDVVLQDATRRLLADCGLPSSTEVLLYDVGPQRTTNLSLLTMSMALRELSGNTPNSFLSNVDYTRRTVTVFFKTAVANNPPNVVISPVTEPPQLISTPATPPPRRVLKVPRNVSDVVYNYTRKYCAQDEVSGRFYGRKDDKFWPEGFNRAVTAIYNNCTKAEGWTKLKTEQHVGRYLVNTNSSTKNARTSSARSNQCIEKAKKWKERYGTHAVNGTTPPGWEVRSDQFTG